MTRAEWNRWTGIGTGVGIAIGAADLDIAVVRVRPRGVRVLGTTKIARYLDRPAAEWGSEYLAFLKRLGVGHLAATVLLPRSEMMVRPVDFPGVADKDLEAAIRLQLDSLHPFAEENVAYGWARIPNTPTVLIGITRRETQDRYSTLFAQAGIKIASFTFSAAALYSAIRLRSEPPAGFVAMTPVDDGVEVYGESVAKPVFSAHFETASDRVRTLAAAELRLGENGVQADLKTLLPPAQGVASPLVYSAALQAACPRLSLRANLLPPELRSTSSRIMWVPTAAAALLLTGVVLAAGMQERYENGRLLAAIDAEVRKLEPKARRAAEIDKQIAAIRSRTRLLEDYQKRTRNDLETLNEATRLIPPPSWLNMFDMTRTTVVFSGESEQAVGLLRMIDQSPHFQNSEFTIPLARLGANEVFRIRASREGAVQ